jgi:hypothetical protein
MSSRHQIVDSEWETWVSYMDVSNSGAEALFGEIVCIEKNVDEAATKKEDW